jgi:hypothetical protein
METALQVAFQKQFHEEKPLERGIFAEKNARERSG